jgi:hypothetical protein
MCCADPKLRRDMLAALAELDDPATTVLQVAKRQVRPPGSYEILFLEAGERIPNPLGVSDTHTIAPSRSRSWNARSGSGDDLLAQSTWYRAAVDRASGRRRSPPGGCPVAAVQ